MKTSDEILRQHGIENPTDSALVRLAHRALEEPELTSVTLLDSSGLHNRSDRTLALALIESVREATPAALQPTGSPAVIHRLRFTVWGLAVTALFVSAVAITQAFRLRQTATRLTTALDDNRKLTDSHSAKLAATNTANLEQIAELHKLSTSGLKAAGESGKLFRETTEKYTSTIVDLQKEIARLQTEVDRAKKEKTAN